MPGSENGEDFNVQWLQQNGKFPQVTIEELNARVLMLPYDEHKRLSLLLLIPTDNKLGGIFVRLQRVTIKKIMQELHKNPEENKDGVAIPKVKIVSTVDLKSIIEQLGIEKNPFDNEGKNYEILHKAEFELKEAEQTNTEIVKAADFISEPFAFLVIERHTHTVLLTGQVQNLLEN